MAKKGKAVNRRKAPSGGRKPVVALVVVIALIALGFFLLEHFRSSAPPAKPAAPQATPHQKIPERQPVQGNVSTASVPQPVQPPVAAPQIPRGPGQLAIVIDDMGSSMAELQALLSIKLPITFSVIPSLAHAKGVSEGAHRAGAEVMVHMPMEPEGYPKQPMEKIGLLLNMDDQEIENRVNSYFRTVPFAVGANNHMGSRFTQNAEKMDVVLKVLKERDIFFVDSKTSPASVGYQRAHTLGLKSASRQVFLDNVQDVAAITRQLAQAAAVARKKGAAIAICHPHAATIRALQAAMPKYAESGITFVYASQLVN